MFTTAHVYYRRSACIYANLLAAPTKPLRCMRHNRSSMPDYGIDSPRTGVVILLVVIAGIVAAGLLHFTAGSTARTLSNILFSIVPIGIIILFLIWMYIRRE